jgi:carbonic anhydrase
MLNLVDNAVCESAKRTAVQIGAESRLVAELIEAGKVKVVAARYDLDEGRVEYLS